MLTRRAIMKTGLAAGAALSMPWVARAATRTLRFAHAANEIHPGHIIATSFAESLEKLVPGAFDVQIFPNRQLGDDKQNLESVVAGALDMCNASGVQYPLVTGRPALDAYQLPFLIRDYDHFAKLALSDAAQKIHDDLEPAGLIGLATADIGRRHFLSVASAVKKTDQFAGLKTRIVPVPLHKAIWEAIGVSPVGLPYGEVYGALETKVIDALEINVSSMLGENLWEVGKHFTLTGHYPWHATTAMSKIVFDSFEPDLQAALREAGKQSVIATLDYAKQQDETGRGELQEKGVEIVELEDLDKVKEKVAPIVGQWSQKSPLIAEFVAAAEAS
ncbi:TRAP transporter substrate-binding protein [Consotaella salsifontis]|uniref:Tripartite ATP-independent transporter solute receptor, DctP family n=1 Tax=Consotaella salsifontis TaxID=1365950 RepID=A0A1T4TCB3_9HYPH|nr:TRAP transporter substrate-binding protein [Consotaella salsifontis]SKA38063.1 tripartite ATP-independent transporter solute receptor, DctP family [Consotaella salsifontis]